MGRRVGSNSGNHYKPENMCGGEWCDSKKKKIKIGIFIWLAGV